MSRKNLEERRRVERERYANNPEARARQRERQNRWARDKYHNDPEWRARDNARCCEYQFLHRTWGF